MPYLDPYDSGQYQGLYLQSNLREISDTEMSDIPHQPQRDSLAPMRPFGSSSRFSKIQLLPRVSEREPERLLP